MFWRNMFLATPRSACYLLNASLLFPLFFNPDDGDDIFLQNVMWYHLNGSVKTMTIKYSWVMEKKHDCIAIFKMLQKGGYLDRKMTYGIKVANQKDCPLNPLLKQCYKITTHFSPWFHFLSCLFLSCKKIFLVVLFSFCIKHMSFYISVSNSSSGEITYKLPCDMIYATD
jgi:hypothetical protein